MNKLHINNTINGFTLVELLVTTTIIAIGIITVASMTSKSTAQDARAYHTTKASMVIEDFFEENARTQYDIDDFNKLNNTSFNSTFDNITFNTECTITDNFPVDGCKQMNCTITWNNKGLFARTTYAYTFARKY